MGSTRGSERSPGEGNGNPLQYSCLEKFRGQRILEGNSPWGHKKLDTNEWLSTAHIELNTQLQHFSLVQSGESCSMRVST